MNLNSFICDRKGKFCHLNVWYIMLEERQTSIWKVAMRTIRSPFGWVLIVCENNYRMDFVFIDWFVRKNCKCSVHWIYISFVRFIKSTMPQKIFVIYSLNLKHSKNLFILKWVYSQQGLICRLKYQIATFIPCVLCISFADI